jgi:hypothetical protein
MTNVKMNSSEFRNTCKILGHVAQLDRAVDFYSIGWGFKFLRGHQTKPTISIVGFLLSNFNLIKLKKVIRKIILTQLIHCYHNTQGNGVVRNINDCSIQNEII